MSEVEERQPEYCDFCGWETGDLVKTGVTWWFCSICRSTPASNVAMYPNAHQSTNWDTLRTIIRIGHMVLERVGYQNV